VERKHAGNVAEFDSCPIISTVERMTGGVAMKKLLVLVVLILVGTVSWAQSQTGSGQWLHDLWEGDQRAIKSQDPDPRDMVRSMEYVGFVTGAADVMYDADWLNLEGITYGQWCALVGKYLDDHPEQWNIKAVALVYRALHAAWPGNRISPYQ